MVTGNFLLKTEVPTNTSMERKYKLMTSVNDATTLNLTYPKVQRRYPRKSHHITFIRPFLVTFSAVEALFYKTYAVPFQPNGPINLQIKRKYIIEYLFYLKTWVSIVLKGSWLYSELYHHHQSLVSTMLESAIWILFCQLYVALLNQPPIYKRCNSRPS